MAIFRYLLISTVFTIFPCFAMIFDNRFFPFIQKPYITVDGRSSYATIDFFLTEANSAIGKDKRDVGIPELYGPYDQGELAQAFVAAGMPNPLKSEWQGKKIPWRLEGKIKSQGSTFSYRQKVSGPFYVGLDGYFMRLDSWQEFFLTKDAKNNLSLTPSDIIELDDTRRAMHSAIGLYGNHAQDSGMGDLELYFRIGKEFEYELRCRRIRPGINSGIIFPVSPKRNVSYPSSVPFGGDGHWGWYISGDVEFELKEDLKSGVLLRLNNRFARTLIKRLPIKNEPAIFGLYVGPVRIKPGVTFIFSPYVSMENIRDGLGIQVQYTLTTHDDDCYRDIRSEQERIACPLNLKNVYELSSWGSDYFSLNVFYDFGKVKVDRAFYPIVRFSWDIPASIFVAENVCKTNKVSLGIECNF